MAWRNGGSLSRTLISAARAPSRLSSAPLPRIRPPTASPRLQSRRLSFGPSREWKRRVMRVDFQSARGAGLLPEL
ncbi:conserved hypothetical protein [Ricinus communis]|uniref:Uncharacterized protein n=1 Tax=Ricinus communis TaxID=3988 RepID=B9SNA5_RICCO|nr:conserved hypothetical protein [Ricinus communis]